MSPEFLIIDLFCGAGGTTTGFAMAQREGNNIAKVIACVNHDWKAIKSHWQNHPEVEHYTEDIRTLDLKPLVELLNQNRCVYPDAKIILWASLECTNFSKAKGGQPRDADSRTLAEHLDRYILALDPDYVQIENVVEFMSWGPLDEHGKPVSRKSGSDWMRWRKHIDGFGYRNEWRELNSADYGAYTSRNRLFGCFAKEGLPIVWPESTHAKKPIDHGMFGNVMKWKAVKEVLDFEDEGQSIFTRSKALSPKTLERIYAGLIKYVAGGKDKHEAFLIQYNSGKDRVTSVENPCNTIPTENRFALAQMAFIAKAYSGRPEGKVIPVTGPAGTITTFGGQSLIQPQFLTKYYSGKPENMIGSVNDPSSTLRTKDGNGLVQCFIAKYYGTGGQLNSIDEPASSVTARENLSKIQMVWLDKTYTGKLNHQSIDRPAGVVMPNDKHQLVQAKWIMNTSFGNTGTSVDQPSPPLLASRRHHYIVNPSHGGHSTSTDAPCPVIIARQDKAPLYLIGVEHVDVAIPIYEDEPQIMVDIKIFMALYGISDIKMRMLKVLELLKIQGFPADYNLYGNQADQKKFIGNSVVPHVVKAWCEAMGQRLIDERIAA